MKSEDEHKVFDAWLCGVSLDDIVTMYNVTQSQIVEIALKGMSLNW